MEEKIRMNYKQAREFAIKVFRHGGAEELLSVGEMINPHDVLKYHCFEISIDGWIIGEGSTDPNTNEVKVWIHRM